MENNKKSKLTLLAEVATVLGLFVAVILGIKQWNTKEIADNTPPKDTTQDQVSSKPLDAVVIHIKTKLYLEDKFNKFIKTKDKEIKKEIQDCLDSNLVIYQILDDFPPLLKERDLFIESLEVTDTSQILLIDSLKLDYQLKPNFLRIKIK